MSLCTHHPCPGRGCFGRGEGCPVSRDAADLKRKATKADDEEDRPWEKRRKSLHDEAE